MSVAQVQTQRTGGCPHGLPMGACPICNGMGGGAGTRKDAEKPKSAGEWTWMQCYLAGQLMKAQRENAQESKQMFLNQLTFMQQMGQNIQTFVASMQAALDRIQNSLPPQLQAVFGKIVSGILTPLLNLINKIPVILEKIEQFVNMLREKITDAAQKLTALLGEIKNFVERKLANNLKKLTRKLLRFFIWDNDEEYYGNDEELEIFKSRELKKLKVLISKLAKKTKEDKEDDITDR